MRLEAVLVFIALLMIGIVLLVAYLSRVAARQAPVGNRPGDTASGADAAIIAGTVATAWPADAGGDGGGGGGD